MYRTWWALVRDDVKLARRIEHCCCERGAQGRGEDRNESVMTQQADFAFSKRQGLKAGFVSRSCVRDSENFQLGSVIRYRDLVRGSGMLALVAAACIARKSLLFLDLFRMIHRQISCLVAPTSLENQTRDPYPTFLSCVFSHSLDRSTNPTTTAARPMNPIPTHEYPSISKQTPMTHSRSTKISISSR